MQRNDFKRIFSVERLSSYGNIDESMDVALGRYLWNIAICESFYPLLNFAEIALRNAINTMLVNFYKTDSWYDIIPFNTSSKNMINEMKLKLERADKPVINAHIVSGLSLGFWTAFFDKYYAREPFQACLLKNVFKSAPKHLKERKEMLGRLDSIPCLRNRIFHHERIVHYKDLPQQYERLIETVAWLSPELGVLMPLLDRFKKVYAHDLGSWIQDVQNIQDMQGDK